MTTPVVQKLRSVDGNGAAAHVAYSMCDISFMFPITPATTMPELIDAWAESGRLNIWGQKVDIIPMQSEGGVAGAIHGAAVSGAITASFTSSQGLLLMIPNMFKIAGEQRPCVLHVASRAIGGQALTIYADNNDVMSCRSTGWAMLNSSSVQEVADMAIVAHLATLESSVPFLHWFDGFRTSHEISKIQLPEYSAIATMVNREAVQKLRDRGLNPLHPTHLGTVEGPDVFFQAEERANPFYLAVPGHVDAAMRKVEAVFGRSYHLFDYYGAPDAEFVIVTFGAGAPTTEEAIDYLNSKEGQKYGLVKVRLFRPWSTEHFLKAFPKTVKRIAVMERTKEPGALAEPLLLDVCATFCGVPNAPLIVGGRFGLGCKEYTPASVKTVFENLKLATPKNHFTVGIDDDLTHLNLPILPEFSAVPQGTSQCMFWGLGADGTVGANHDAIKIIGDNTDMFVQGFFYYSAHKSGGLTVSHLRFGKQPIKSEYLINTDADYIACHFPGYVKTYDMLKAIKQNGTFVLNCNWTPEELEHQLPASLKRQIFRRNVSFYTIDASSLAESIGLGRRINSCMQAVFFNLSGVLPFEQAISLLKDAVQRTYKIKGAKIVDMNIAVIDQANAKLNKITVPASWATAEDKPAVIDLTIPQPPAYIENVIRKSLSMEGDNLPVSAFTPSGVNILGTTQYEKRGMGLSFPEWNNQKCTQCTECSMMCPHATIRPYILNPEDVPADLATQDGKGKFTGKKFRIQVSALDCTGCGVCAKACRFGALTMLPATHDRVTKEAANWRKFLPTPQKPLLGADVIPRTTSIGSQYCQPLLEFSGCCEGCGETPYVKMMTQMFGERMCVANAAGCSSVWGGTWGMIPYTTSTNGHGPAWGNSLFEDNAEYGFGMARSHLQRRKRLHDMLITATGEKSSLSFSETTKKMVAQWLDHYSKLEDPQAMVMPLIKQLEEELGKAATNDLMTEIWGLRDQLPKISQWIIGGDGWAYDIDYGGLDHVVAMGSKVNVLIMDTEVYSNTGGQRSKSTNLAAIAKFAAGGNRKNKKDLGMMLMAYGDIYVASVCLHANPTQCARAIAEAEAYPGTSVILAYSGCKEHGFPMDRMVEETKAAVDSGYWPLYRFDPRKTPALQYDSKMQAGKVPLQDFLMRENRYAALTRQNEPLSKELFASLSASKAATIQRLKSLSEQTVAKASAALSSAEPTQK